MLAPAAALPALVADLRTEDETLADAESVAPVSALVRRAQTGDRGAFRELFLQHRSEVARVVFRVLGPSSELEDVVQEVFFQVHRSLGAFRGQSKFSTWLHRVAVNVALQHIRKKRAGLPPATTAEVPDRGTEPGSTFDPLATTLSSERLAAVYRILGTLSEKKRAVFVLHDLQGVPAGEIARTLGTNVLTVRTRLFYARKEFYARLKDEPSFGEGWR